jgi:type II secretory pathway component PulK
MRQTREARGGMALVLAVVILALVTAVTGMIAWQTNAARRLLDDRRQQLQALWLARAGVEHACDRLLAEPDKYTGETLELIPRGQVHLSVERDPKTRNQFRLVSEARYPADQPHPKVRTVIRRIHLGH